MRSSVGPMGMGMRAINQPGPNSTVIASYRGALAERLTAMGLTVVEPGSGRKTWRIQQALVAVNLGSLAGTALMSLRAGGNVQVIDPEGRIVGSSEVSATHAHINEEAGLSRAAAKAGDAAGAYVLGLLMDRLTAGGKP